MNSASDDLPIYEIAGEQVTSLEDFYRLMGEAVRQDLERAQRHEGATVFDWLVDIVHELPSIELQLH